MNKLKEKLSSITDEELDTLSTRELLTYKVLFRFAIRNDELKKELKKKTSRCTERNHKIRCRDRKLERRNKRISKLEEKIDKIQQEIKYYSNADMCYENDKKFINNIIEILSRRTEKLKKSLNEIIDYINKENK